MSELLAARGRFITDRGVAGGESLAPARRPRPRPRLWWRHRQAAGPFDRLPDPQKHLAFWIKIT